MFLNYINTIKYLKPIQILYRLKASLRIKPISRKKNIIIRKISKTANFPSVKRNPFSEKNTVISFLNKKVKLEDTKWQPKDLPKLWIYNFHYLDFLNSEFSSKNFTFCHESISNWVEANPDFKGIGWETYPTSIRAINLCKFFINNDYYDLKLCKDLYDHGRLIYRNMEYHILGNHLFTNAKALIFLGIFFDDKESERWLNRGKKIFFQQLQEQILDDGGHFELSPMYHLLFLEDLIDIYCLCVVTKNTDLQEIENILKEKIKKMINWSSLMNHPDGNISFFNDACNGVAPALEKITDVALNFGVNISKDIKHQTKSGINHFHLIQSGYIRVESPECIALLDVAKIGPDYLPGHGHADTLSFELSLFNQRTLVNGGISTYEINKKREYERSTLNHNTLMLCGKSSSEVWKSFRVADRANPSNLEISDEKQFLEVSCEHDGYRKFKYAPKHRRVWRFGANMLEISDLIDSNLQKNTNYKSRVNFMIHPEVNIKQLSGSVCELKLRNGKLIKFKSFKQKIYLEDCFYSSEFGESQETKRIFLESSDNAFKIKMSW